MFESFFIGLDLGRIRDFTAIAVLERAVLKKEFDPAVFAFRKEVQIHLRHLERVPIGTPYPDVVDRVAQITRSPELTGPIHLAVDNTGVGAAVMDLLRLARPQATLMPVTITAGDSENVCDGAHRVPKRDLIVGLQVLLQRGGLRIAAGLKGAPALLAEMMAMQVKVSAAGNEQYAAWREGTHDDLVFAVALACWSVGKAYPKRKAQDEGWWGNPYEADMIRKFKKQMGER
jgi:hypothetical protein